MISEENFKTRRDVDRVTKDSRTKKRKLWGRSDRHFISGGRKGILLLEGSQEMPARPSDKYRMRVKTLGW
jgi:hypothetical protein